MGIIVFFREVREDEVARRGVKALWISEVLADRVVREMASAAQYSLLNNPWIRTRLEHVRIVI